MSIKYNDKYEGIFCQKRKTKLPSRAKFSSFSFLKIRVAHRKRIFETGNNFFESVLGPPLGGIKFSSYVLVSEHCVVRWFDCSTRRSQKRIDGSMTRF